MKRTLKRTLIALGATVGIAVLLMVAVLLKFRSETSGMSPIDTGQVVQGVYAVRDDFANFFLVKAGDDFISIDAGNSWDAIKGELGKIDVDPNRVKAVFLTHSDGDHIGAIRGFERATVYISKQEKQMVDGTAARLWFFKNKLPRAYEMLEDGQVVTINGLEIKGILTPGHTPGSMSYLVDGKYLFTGDNLSLKAGKAGAFNEFFNMDTSTQKKSLKNLAALSGVEYVFTDHYGSTADFDAAFADWKR